MVIASCPCGYSECTILYRPRRRTGWPTRLQPAKRDLEFSKTYLTQWLLHPAALLRRFGCAAGSPQSFVEAQDANPADRALASVQMLAGPGLMLYVFVMSFGGHLLGHVPLSSWASTHLMASLFVAGH